MITDTPPIVVDSSIAIKWVIREPDSGAAEAIELVEEAYRISSALDHPIYDCLYLALGQRLGAPVVTADRRLVAASQRFAAFQGTVLTLPDLA